MDLLRFTTAGSVDDGKSTLIGRLFYDTKSIFEDRLSDLKNGAASGPVVGGDGAEATEASGIEGATALELARLTDGLRAEREQGITIDVAYRYFATPKRKFIIADTPGHEQYTRNMVTGASTAELAVVLIDARKGMLEQSRRHGFIASLLQIPHIVVAVNKMDLVDYDEAVFRRIEAEYRAFAERLNVADVAFIPLSALYGDNVVEKSDRMPWYQGSTLLHRLETVKTGVERNKVDFRFPVQYVIRPNQDFRGFAGQVASGTIRPGEEVVVLPSNRVTRVAALTTFDGEQEQAGPGDSVTLTLDDEIDASRGSMIVRARNRPEVATRLDADLCWMGEEPMRTDRPYVLQHTSREVQALVDTIVYRINMNTLHREEAGTFKLNEIGRVELATSDPLFFDAYNANRATGSFILIDPDTNATVAAGMIRGAAQGVSPVGTQSEGAGAEAPVSPNVVWEGLNIDRAKREQDNGHKAAVLWLTGLSGAGKSTIAREVEQRLFDRGIQAVMLDGDHVRHGLCGDLGFSPADRQENVRRVGEVARLFFEQGNLTLCTFVSPYQQDRDRVRALVPEGRFVEIFVEADIETLKQRDPKGLYEKALAGEIINFTGITAPYEAPANPELVLNTEDAPVAACAERLIAYLEAEGLLPADDTDA